MPAYSCYTIKQGKIMKLVKPALLTLAIASLAACGSSSDSEDNGSIAFTEFDLANYQPVSDSGNFKGIWVAVWNYSGTANEGDIDYTFDASQKMVFSIFSGDQEKLYVTDCNGVSIALDFNEEVDFIEEQTFIEGNEVMSVIDNNIMVLRELESDVIWYAVKINHSPASLGSVTTEGSGTQTGEYSQLAVGLCQQSIAAKTTSGHTFVMTSTEVSMADNLELSVDPQNISELDFTRKDYKGPEIDGDYDIELKYKRFLTDSFVYLDFNQENDLGDNIEYTVSENSSNFYAGKFLVTSSAGEQAAAFTFNLSY